MHEGTASRLEPLLRRILLGSPEQDAELPIRVRAWDGSEVGPEGAPVFALRHRRALRRLLWKPGELGLARAYVAGELDIEGDIFAALGAVQRVMRGGDEPIRLGSDEKREIVRTAVMLGAVGPEPRPPDEELPPGRRADEAVLPAEPNEFFRLLLGPALVYVCARWEGAADLAEAQRTALDSVVSRLGLFPGARVLDLSAGWGGLAMYAARLHRVRVVGLVRSPEQADHLRAEAARAGLTDRVEARQGGLRAAGGGPYDAVVGLSGAEHFGPDLPRIRELLAPGGRLVLQQIARRPGPHPIRRTFTTSYMFPEAGALWTLGDLVGAIETAGLEVRTVGALREDYARTLRAWAANLQRHWDECGALATPGRARAWLLYLAASALACESGRIGMHEICAIRRDRDGRAGEALVAGREVLSR
ncbi:SAM-dependent methyltransferase [Actinomadura craniellae]|uniref:SAM-dependent methyltransferase n=1 Tax=Actinomadura craniellae TaxID=2231787 RepID=A0A365H5H5_9ACTN|nr:class I SAM-dependent methyltransferase [Actinomadura craniellae]RAY14341.1 SAM-dependent methyltransferase [Actinomadura craniellae]